MPKLANQKLQADIYRQEMEAAAVPVEAAGRMASAMASMGQSLDPSVKAAAAGMTDSVYGILGIKEKTEIVTDARGRAIGSKMVPVQPPAAVNQFRENIPQPSYRQRFAQPQQLPPAISVVSLWRVKIMASIKWVAVRLSPVLSNG